MSNTPVMAALITCTSLTGHIFAEDRSANLAKNHPAEHYKAPRSLLPEDKGFIFKVEDHGAKGDGRTETYAWTVTGAKGITIYGNGATLLISPDRFCLPIGIHAGGIIHIQDGKNNTLEDAIIYASPVYAMSVQHVSVD